jgi:hypothetical protein
MRWKGQIFWISFLSFGGVIGLGGGLVLLAGGNGYRGWLTMIRVISNLEGGYCVLRMLKSSLISQIGFLAS